MSADPRELLQSLGQQAILPEPAAKVLPRRKAVVDGLAQLDADLRRQSRRRKRLMLLVLAATFATLTAAATTLVIISNAQRRQDAMAAVVTRPTTRAAERPPMAAAPPDAELSDVKPEAVRADGPTASTGRGANGSPRASAEQPASRTRTSSLAEENELLAHAKAATRQADYSGALAQLDRLLAQYPRSPLRHNASVERFRVLAKMGRHAEAAQAARRYLADYPQGFARDEARAVAVP